MGTTGKVFGKNMFVFLGGVKVANVTSTDFSRNTDMIDVTDKDSENRDREYLPGLNDATANFTAFMRYDNPVDRENFQDIDTNQGNQTPFDLRISTGLTGDLKTEASMYVESTSFSAGVDEYVTYDVSMKPAGAVTVGAES